jgi:class 3 adenylate cyclase
MDFYEVLTRVIEILQREGRTSYRALKRQFGVDDAYLEDLKVELIEVKQLAVDHEGTMLVWTGAAPPSQTGVPLPTQPPSQRATQDTRRTPAESLSIAPPAPDAERRQLTVLFCDLVESTRLSGQLDPEEWREVVRAYQDTCAKVIARYEGHIAQYLGDGLLVYFGYPQAHEDDAQRAVRAGLGIVEAVGQLNTRLEQEQGVQLAVRLGIHTCLVVVGEMGGGARREQLALCETPNMVSRLQALAGPNTVAISAATSRLVQGLFECRDLGSYTVKGVSTPVPPSLATPTTRRAWCAGRHSCRGRYNRTEPHSGMCTGFLVESVAEKKYNSGAWSCCAVLYGSPHTCRGGDAP